MWLRPCSHLQPPARTPQKDLFFLNLRLSFPPVKKLKLTSVFFPALFILGSITLYPKASFAIPLSPDQIRATLDRYQALLLQVASEPRTSKQSLFLNPKGLSESNILKGVESLQVALQDMSSPELISYRLEALDLIRRHQPISPVESDLLKKELEILNSRMRSVLVHWDRNHYFSTCFLGMAGGVLTAITGISLNSALNFNEQPWVYPTLIATGCAGIHGSSWLANQFRLDRCVDLRPWSTQFSTLGKKVESRFKHELESEGFGTFPYDMTLTANGEWRQLFPTIPLYIEILDWIASQPQFLQNPVLQTPMPVPSEEHTVIQIETEAQNQAPSPEASRVLETYRTQNVSRWTFGHLDSKVFRESIQWIAQEIRNQPYSLWSVFSSHRLLMLALNRDDSSAVLELINAQKVSVSDFFIHQKSIFNLALLLAVKQNNAALLSRLLHDQTDLRLFKFLPLEYSLWEEVRKIASTPNHAEVREILDAQRLLF